MDLIKTKSFQLATYSKGDKDSKKLALVLPGKLDTKDYAHMVSHVNYLADLGFFALSFDPPGTWESPGDISLYNTTNYLKAIDELIEYFGNKPTFVMGHSRGGSMAMLSSFSNPTIKAFVAIMSYAYKSRFSDKKIEEWKEKEFIEEFRDLPPGGGPETKYFKLPYSFHEDQCKYNAIEGLKKLTKPKLFIYGTKDTNVPPAFVREAYEISANPKEIFELDWDHNYRLNENKIDEVNKVIHKFLKNFNLI